MAIKVDLISNLDELQLFLKDLPKKMVPKANRMAIRRTSKILVTESVRAIRKVRSLGAREIRKDFFKTKLMVQGFDVNQHRAELAIRKRPVSLIRFVRGSKNPRPQRGIKVRRRRPLRVSVVPGKTSTLQDAFIAKGRGNRNHVFRRRTVKNTPIIKQSIPSLHLLFTEKEFRRPIERIVGKRLQVEFKRALRLQVDRAKAKAKS